MFPFCAFSFHKQLFFNFLPWSHLSQTFSPHEHKFPVAMTFCFFLNHLVIWKFPRKSSNFSPPFFFKTWLRIFIDPNTFKYIYIYIYINIKAVLLFYNTLSDCHYSDVINSLLNAFRWKKMSCTLVISCKTCCGGFWKFLIPYMYFYVLLI